MGQVPHPALRVRPRQPASMPSIIDHTKHNCFICFYQLLYVIENRHLNRCFCLLVAEEEVVEEDGDLELGEVVAGAEPSAKAERQERAGPRQVALPPGRVELGGVRVHLWVHVHAPVP